MTHFETVKTAIEKLSPVECVELQHWLEQQNNDDQPTDPPLKGFWMAAQ